MALAGSFTQWKHEGHPTAKHIQVEHAEQTPIAKHDLHGLQNCHEVLFVMRCGIVPVKKWIQ